MDAVAQRKIQLLAKTAENVRAKDLNALFKQYAAQTSVLSLDCFDTILWRKTAAPHDVFFDLAQQPTFKSLGVTAMLRAHSETRARQRMLLNTHSYEVTLADIYRASFPMLSLDQIHALTEEEFAAERQACYAFPPMLELIRLAHQHRHRIIIVSDTYFTEQQLRRLLTHALPADVLNMIDHIYCSCDHGIGKTSGIFKKIMTSLKVSPENILHIGDNLSADYLSPKQLKINSVHFVHQEECINDIFELQTAAASLLDPLTRTVRSMANPFRGLLATRDFPSDKPETLIGYASLGPLMYAFGQFILKEVEDLKASGKRPKVVFLMRDAYLPSLVTEAIHGESIGKRIRISRFASYAASYRNAEDIDHYLLDAGKTNRLYDLARQLLLPEELTASLIKEIKNHADPVAGFLRILHRADVIKVILAKSADYRVRLIQHLKNEVDLKSGDTLVLVDLGYSGTAQRRLAPIFEEIGVEVRGCYLISLTVPHWKESRSGLLDPSWCDENAMLTIVFYITILEQLCTSNEKSVIDYNANGQPIYSEVKMHSEQQDKLISIQSECVRFSKEAMQFFKAANLSISLHELRKFAFAELARMIFFQTKPELDYLKSFEGETNLGTQDTFRMFDPDKGLTGLRRRGMFYMEKPSKKTRTNYPAELRMAGMEYVLSLIAQQRYNLDIKLKNMILRTETLPILFMQGIERYQTSVEALSTYDGYFSVWLPGELQVALQLGKNYRWVQLESAEMINKEDFIQQCETQNTQDVMNTLIFNQMVDQGGHLYECLSEESNVLMKPVSALNPTDYLFRVVFRPTVKRTSG